MNHFIDALKLVAFPIHKEGYKFILIFAFATIILALFSDVLGTIGLVLTLWCVFFFRDPHRVIPAGDQLVISPADGKVTEINLDVTPPSELGLAAAKWNKITVFLNVFNVHVNRVPMAGVVQQVNYREGKFLSANAENASAENERNSVVVKTKDGKEIVFIQIAGLVARRIVSELKEGQQVNAGEKYGIIRFGSRADIYLPQDAKIKVLVGQTMIGGESVLAEF